MALHRKPRNVKEWLLHNQPVTWVAHGLITLLVSSTITLGLFPFYHTLLPKTLVFALSATIAATLYFLKEQFKDEPKHKEDGDWNTPDYMGVTPMLDKYGDALFPAIVAVSSWVFYLTF